MRLRNVRGHAKNDERGGGGGGAPPPLNVVRSLKFDSYLDQCSLFSSSFFCFPPFFLPADLLLTPSVYISVNGSFAILTFRSLFQHQKAF